MKEPGTFNEGLVAGITLSAVLTLAILAVVAMLFSPGCVSAPRWPTCEEFRRIDPNDSGLAFMVKDRWPDGVVIVCPVEEPGYGRVTGLEWRETPIGMNPCWWEARGFSPAGRRAR